MKLCPISISFTCANVYNEEKRRNKHGTGIAIDMEYTNDLPVRAASQGYLISVEGGEGAGKSTIVALLQQALEAEGAAAIASREPGGIPIAEQIRSVILDRGNTAMDGRTEALLYAAARRQHYVEKILPALQAGITVICDRFIDSSLAYQGHARGLGIPEILAINTFAIGSQLPDLTIYLDIDPEVGLARIHASGQREVNRLDLESMAFHHKVREGYQLLAGMYASRVVTVDASQPQEAVLGEVKQILANFLVIRSK